MILHPYTLELPEHIVDRDMSLLDKIKRANQLTSQIINPEWSLSRDAENNAILSLNNSVIKCEEVFNEEANTIFQLTYTGRYDQKNILNSTVSLSTSTFEELIMLIQQLQLMTSLLNRLSCTVSTKLKCNLPYSVELPMGDKYCSMRNQTIDSSYTLSGLSLDLRINNGDNNTKRHVILEDSQKYRGDSQERIQFKHIICKGASLWSANTLSIIYDHVKKQFELKDEKYFI